MREEEFKVKYGVDDESYQTIKMACKMFNGRIMRIYDKKDGNKASSDVQKSKVLESVYTKRSSSAVLQQRLLSATEHRQHPKAQGDVQVVNPKDPAKGPSKTGVPELLSQVSFSWEPQPDM